MVSEFEVGDIVTLRSETRHMTITSCIAEDLYEVSWLSESCELQESVFHAKSLCLIRSHSKDAS